MFPGDVSVNFTISRTKVSVKISDKNCVKIFYSCFGDTQCPVHYWAQEKNEVCVRFLQTLFFRPAKGHDVVRKILEKIQEIGYQ